MSFGQFLIYFIASEFILQGSIIGLLLLRKRLERKVEKLATKNKVRFVTEDELLDLVEERDKKPWN